MRKGFDLDGVVFNFAKSVIRWAGQNGYKHLFPRHWSVFKDEMNTFIPQPILDTFWMDVTSTDSWWFWKDMSLMPGAYLDEAPEVYITSRPIDPDISKQALVSAGFPVADVVRTHTPEDKLNACLQYDLDCFVDDSPKNFWTINKGGVICLMANTPRNVNVARDIGPEWRINYFWEIEERVANLGTRHDDG